MGTEVGTNQVVDIEILKRLQKSEDCVEIAAEVQPMLPAIIAALEDRERLRVQFLDWGRHRVTCIREVTFAQARCSCGWDKFRATLEGREA